MLLENKERKINNSRKEQEKNIRIISIRVEKNTCEISEKKVKKFRKKEEFRCNKNLLKHNKRLRSSTKKMNVSDSESEIISYWKIIKGTTVFYSFPYDVETALIKAQKATNTMAEIGQRCINNLHDRNNITLNTTAKDH